MDDQEFGRLLDLFPVVRPRNYHIETDPSRQSTSRSFPEPVYQEEEGKKESNNQVIDVQDAFWEKLKLAVEKKAGAAEAQRFCKAFQEIHRKLVYEELSLDAACSFINLSKSSGR
ncbi:hypothetical protein NC652_002865 [Populus alba x Populus x berolinensis]|uniref:Uncharacterized protein n=3 Tax=Populus TaxID=3689 RepID=A0A4U5QH13_POPAL|nr:uncharacterized protein LOC118055530 [Populus alba]KAG6792965.1 hypothetical protein POTOM_002132 [Populus tomentosa]KAJ6964760.1 hypothetical protein NC652_002865 [Populus alba x Populus x berolinensis]KAJ7013081.1 hypothetical protein NC653_002947 [Populus alba x Populus x berolinensis]TKS07825.1 hypothetical protein D5086_0000108650 [Populus alba]